ncbi:MAG: geranylgeranyl reductase family protein, partial [Candidatus Diapherotrites archaeon]|nr:geranylgeranyl reductase family protein [Candidatus Diapherotrites archaeon]
MTDTTYDAIIVGAGPAGSAAATLLGQTGRKVLLLDKAKFPRDKTCGDAISGSLSVHKLLNLEKEIRKKPHGEVHGVIFSSPDGTEINIPYSGTGFVCRRQDYDNLVFKTAKKHAETIEEFTVTDLLKDGDYVVGVKGKTKDGKEREIKSKVVVGADGAFSVVARKTDLLDLDPEHLITAARCYYSNIEGLTDSIEMHFLEEVLPGYFWVFPLENGHANVGIGMTQKDFRKHDWKMTDKIFELVKTHPKFKERFKNAKLVEGTMKGWTLPT